VVWKRHLDISAASLEELEATRAACPYPTNGLVFTPRDPPYVLGMEQLLRKWRPADQVAEGIQAGGVYHTAELDAGIRPVRLVPGLVYECCLEEEDRPLSLRRGVRRQTGPQWRPASIRWDKRRGNHPDALDVMKGRRWTAWLAHSSLVLAVGLAQARQREILRCQCAEGPQGEDGHVVTPLPRPLHQAWAHLPFDEFYLLIMSAVAEGRVERTVDAATGLEIFNCRQYRLLGPVENSGGLPASPDIEDVCRGLVCHPPSARVVATPFCSFFDSSSPDRMWPTSSRTELAHATFKVDGSLVIAFLWKGELLVCTRRRMDSQQALWAQAWAAWLRSSVPADAFEPGWTYLFEAVFEDNTVVVPYPFDAPVLLAAVSPDGTRSPHAICVALAARMGVMLAPSLAGTLGDFERFLTPRGVVGMPRASADSHFDSNSDSLIWDLPLVAGPIGSTTLLAFEGWIVTRSDGSNEKLVCNAYKQASRAAANCTRLMCGTGCAQAVKVAPICWRRAVWPHITARS
jgi:hypothetical protein